MNYKSSKLTVILPKAVRILTVCCILFSGLFILFYSPKTISAQSTIDCADPSITDSKPGSNCLYSSGSSIQKLCETVPNADYTIDPDNILLLNPIHRLNCMNLRDLQLCTHLEDLYATCINGKGAGDPACDIFEAKPGENCAQNCNSDSFVASDTTDIRGIDYAIHNRHCLRFCDEITEEDTNYGLSSSATCQPRGCHQLATGTVPEPDVNCIATSCNLLTISELNNITTKLLDDDNNDREHGAYCNKETDATGKTLKCYKFSEAQLPYTILNKMCQPHNCKAPCSNYRVYEDVNGDGVIDGNDHDDTLNISNQGTDYENAYIKNINAKYDLDDTSLCNQVFCKPIVDKQYRCTTNGTIITGDANKDIILNLECDPPADPDNPCPGNICIKEIDCNNPANDHELECVTGSEEGETIATDDNSWFYKPQPMDKATNGSGYITSSITEKPDSICYTKDQLGYHTDTSSDDQRWGVNMKIPLPWGGNWDLGYAHSFLLPDKTRSPGLCDPSSSGKVTREGSRGNGYIYLCGTNLNLYSKPADHTAYHKGSVSTYFTEEDGFHELRVCLRMTNAMRPSDGASETCGKRECGISCLFGICKSQVCGYDVCRTLKIKDSYPDECELDAGIFIRDPDRDCMATIDDYLRIRVQKYGNEICSYLDVKGHLAYELDWFNDGSERVNDLICTNGDEVVDGICNGFDSGGDPGTADKWRTVNFNGNGNIPYITNNQPIGEPAGYRNIAGRLFPAQNCIKTALRLPPPRFYNLANASNSPKLFIPPIFVSSVFSVKGGLIAIPAEGKTYANTDFNRPEINVKFGSTIMRLSLETDFDGYEADRQEAEDPNSKGEISTVINTVRYSANILVRKEFDEFSKKPTFCLYRKMQAADGTDLLPLRLQCVDRNLPEYDNSLISQAFSSIPPRKIVINPSPSNSFTNGSIMLQYLTGLGLNKVDDNCSDLGDDDCTSALILNNPNQSTPNCSTEKEQFTICAQREKCNELNNECMQNEIDLQDAIIAKESTVSHLLFRRNCNEVLLPFCNKKKGITTTSGSPTITNPNPSGTNAHPNAYGWFDEICLMSGSKTDGFDHELDLVIAYSRDSLPGGVKGKCKILDSSPYLTDNDINTNCDDGGKAPNCLCENYFDDSSTLTIDQEVRLETYREAGFCVDLPVPETCPAIIANPNESSDANDVNYVNSSMSTGANFYNDSTGVHTSHQNRTNNVGHADFPLTIMGTNSVEGTCKGFWKYQVPSNGIARIPTLNCINNNGSAEWDIDVNNAGACERYTCEAVLTNGPIASTPAHANYSHNYGVSEVNEDKGRSHGFALWPSYQKTNDFPEAVTATSCIAGFKPSGSTALPNLASSLKQEITGYSTGTPATRQCNQRGIYQAPSNSCERITCPSINPPASPTTNADWLEWTETGGATFTAVNASRSDSFITAESIQTGTCNIDLGFFQLGGNAPSRTCDSLGNWGPVTDACSTKCNAVTASDITLPSENHGNAYWPETFVSAGSEIEVESIDTAYNGCAASGYKRNPYPTLNKPDGNLFTLTSSPADYTTTIPVNLYDDDRWDDGNYTPTKPKRLCTSVTLQGTSTSAWVAASSSCITACPGFLEDSRINVGRTLHPSSYGTEEIRWKSTNFGTWSFASKHGSSNITNNGVPYLSSGAKANDYSGNNRTNGDYMIARRCGDDGKWDEPITQCVTNSGVITDSNATYSNSTRGNTKTVDIGEIANSTTCISQHYNTDINIGSPKPISSYSCEYKNSNKNIDEVYFKYHSGSPCKSYCKAVKDQIFNATNIYTPANTIYKDPDEVLTLECKSGNGTKIVPNTTGGLTSQCGRGYTKFNSDRSSNQPYVTCNADGTWSTTQNSCSACRSCNSSDTFYVASSVAGSQNENGHYGCLDLNSTTLEIFQTCRTNDVDYEVAHTAQKPFVYSNGKWCSGNRRNMCWGANLQCLDGQFKRVSPFQYSDAYCDGRNSEAICNQ